MTSFDDVDSILLQKVSIYHLILLLDVLVQFSVEPISLLLLCLEMTQDVLCSGRSWRISAREKSIL